MFKKYKQFILGFLVSSLIFTSMTVFADSKEIKAILSDIKVSINGQILELKDAKGNKVAPIVFNGTTYLPVRSLADAFGKDANFNSGTNAVEITDKIVINQENPNISKIKVIKNPTLLPVDTSDKEQGLEYVNIDNVYYVGAVDIVMKYSSLNYRLERNSDDSFNLVWSNDGKTILVKENMIPAKINSRFVFTYDYYLKEIKPLLIKR